MCKHSNTHTHLQQWNNKELSVCVCVCLSGCDDLAESPFTIKAESSTLGQQEVNVPEEGNASDLHLSHTVTYLMGVC